MSTSSDGTESNGLSGDPALSSDGGLVAFDSDAANLVSGDTNGVMDIFIRNRTLQTTFRASVATAGTQANGGSATPDVSGDGRFVVFQSSASNLVPSDTNGLQDIFLRDLDGGQTSRVSISSAGAQANGASEQHPRVTSTGRFVVFGSEASNLVSGDTNARADIFIHDREAGTTARVSIASDGAQADVDCFEPAVSGDGRFIVFRSGATTLVPGDTNNAPDVFVRDRQLNTTTRVSVSDGEVQANDQSFVPDISDDGNLVAFVSRASNLVPGDTNGVEDIFVRNVAAGTTVRVNVASGGTQADSASYFPSLSADGRYVMFRSEADNLVPGDTNLAMDIFLHDVQTGVTVLLSPSSSGSASNERSIKGRLSSDGRFAAFESYASNLVLGDTNSVPDIFVRGPLLP